MTLEQNKTLGWMKNRETTYSQILTTFMVKNVKLVPRVAPEEKVMFLSSVHRADTEVMFLGSWGV